MKKVILISKVTFLVLSLVIIPLALFMAPALLTYTIESETTALGYGYLCLLIVLSISSYVILKRSVGKALNHITDGIEHIESHCSLISSKY